MGIRSRLRRAAAVAAGRTRLAQLARLWGGGRFPVVLSYHSVAAGEIPPPYVSPALAIPRPLFRRQLERLARRHHIVSVLEIRRALEEQRELPAGTVALTFDDGYADNVELALPELRAIGVSATAFVTTAPLLRRAPLWTAELALSIETTHCRRVEYADRVLDLASPESRLTSRGELTRAWAILPPSEVSRQLQALTELLEVPFGLASDVVMDTSAACAWTSAGLDLAPHTMNHPNLAYQSPEVVRAEVAGASRDLEGLLGHPPEVLAYPNCGGLPRHYNQATTAVVRDLGFRTAFTSDPGPITPHSDLLALPRLSVGRRLWNVDLLEAEMERVRLRGARSAT